MKGKIETMKSISFGKSNAKGKNTINKNYDKNKKLAQLRVIGNRFFGLSFVGSNVLPRDNTLTQVHC